MDSSGNSRTGTLVGDATFVPGLLGQALTLDGTGDYVNIVGYKGVLGTSAFSVSLWVNTTGNGTMVNWGTQTNGQRIDLRLDQGRLRVEIGGSNLQGKTVLNDGQWRHVAMTVAAGASLSYPQVIFYLDGKDDSQTTTDTDPMINIVANVDFTIGRRQTNSDRIFTGMLDDVRVYNRVLTAAEIQTQALRPRAYKPDPADKAEGVTIPMFTWQPRQTAMWHDLYLGTGPELGPADLVSPRGRVTTYYHAPGLTPGATYYWKVDEIESDGTVYPGDVWNFTFASKEAWKPVPADGEPYTDPSLTLTWRPGLNAISHDVYFGTDKTAVAEGAADTFKGNSVLSSLPTGLLSDATTYYWRVDEVNAVGGKIKGPVWTFGTLPVISVAEPNLVAWWTFDDGRGTRGVDWSGHGHHAGFTGGAQWVQGYDRTALHFSGANQYLEATGYEGVLGTHDRTVAAWIQTTEIGDIMAWGLQTDTQKWNFRVQSENGTVGALRVECQGGRIIGWTDLRDGEWHHVAAVLQGAGAPTVLDVRLYVDGVQEAISDSQSVAINTTSGGRSVRIGDGHQNRPFQGLIDDARIYDKALIEDDLALVMRIEPLRAWAPQPRSGALIDIRSATPLAWSEGDDAAQHEVYFGDDANAVAAATSEDTTGIYRGRQSRASFTPSEDLVWARKYFWRVDEVNGDGSVTPGTTWTFTIADYLIVDDFESYNNEDESMGMGLYHTWIDGYNDQSSGSVVGNWDAPFAERRVAYVYSGAQAMPMDYNNVHSPYYSEAARTWTTPQNWLFNDVNTLVVHFRGEPTDLVRVAPDHIIMSAAGWDIWHDAALTRFDEFRFVYKRLTGDGTIIVRVDSITNTNVWAKGGVMIRESLDWASRHASVFVTPGQGVAFQRRLSSNAAGVSVNQTGAAAPLWVKLTRTGNLLAAQHSADGKTWGDVTSTAGASSDTVVMGGSIYIGLALTSHSAGVACTAEFSNIQTTGSVSGE